MKIANAFINCKINNKVKKRIMKKWINRFIKYYRNPKNEFGFMVLSLMKKWTNLPANVLIDDGGLWTNIGNKQIILFQINNNYYRDFNKIIPMSIENEPQILVKNVKIDLSNFEIEQIKDFVKKCQKELIQIADDYDHSEFFEKIRNKGFYKEKCK
ncbi:MAG: hypothetical protein FWE72_00810 [Spirochaetaceae bacterium]|nr:hypothetical protein [Spirochaetaceae bacterium]